MSDVIDLQAERKKREPAPPEPVTARLEPILEDGQIVLELDLPLEMVKAVAEGDTLLLIYEPAAARALARKILARVGEAHLEEWKKK